MSTHASLDHEKTTHAQGGFGARLRKNLGKELATISSIARPVFGMTFALILGILLFISEFNLVRMIFALIALPLGIFFVGKYLTLLPMYIVIGMAVISIVSISSSDKGDNLVNWFTEIIDSFLGAFKKVESKSSTLSQKLFRFVMFSAVASFFLVFLM